MKRLPVYLCVLFHHRKAIRLSFFNKERSYMSVCYANNSLYCFSQSGLSVATKHLQHLVVKLNMDWSHQQYFYNIFLSWEAVLLRSFLSMYIFPTGLSAVNVFHWLTNSSSLFRDHITASCFSKTEASYWKTKSILNLFEKNYHLTWYRKTWKRDCTVLI